jgi:hypothetical protein
MRTLNGWNPSSAKPKRAKPHKLPRAEGAPGSTGAWLIHDLWGQKPLNAIGEIEMGFMPQAFKQMLEFYKSVFYNTFNALTLLQEQTERMINMPLEQGAMLPREGVKVFTAWLKVCRNGSEIYQKAVDEAFRRQQSSFHN